MRDAFATNKHAARPSPLIAIGILVAFLCTVAYLTTSPHLTGGQEQARVAMNIDLNDGWATDDGTPVQLAALKDLPGFSTSGVTISHALPDSIEPDTELIYITKNVTVHQRYGDEEVYVHDLDPERFGVPYATHFNFTPLSPANAGETVTLFIRPAYDESTSQILDVRISGTATYIQGFVCQHALAYVMSTAIVFGGITILLLSVVLRNVYHSDLDLLSLSSVSILLGTWTASQTLIPQLVTGYYALARALEYLSLLFVPYPAVCFAISLSRPPNPKRYKHVALAGLVATLVYTLAHVSQPNNDMHGVLTATHVYILFGIVLILVTIERGLRSRRQNLQQGVHKSNPAIFVAFLLLALCAATDLVIYVATERGATDSAFFSRLGLLIFTGAIATEALKVSVTFVRKTNEMEMMERIAYTDSLTNIGNHTAWQRLETEVMRAMDDGVAEDAMVCQFDLNFLKRVNDTLGHAAGDAYLRSAADVLNRSYGTEGTCFRTGGDEFTAIIVGSSLEERRQRCHKLFDESIREHESSGTPVSIAVGWATVSEVDEHTIAAAQKLADARMYQNKHLMKAERTD